MFPHSAVAMFLWMAKMIVPSDTYDASAAGLLISAVQIKAPG